VRSKSKTVAAIESDDTTALYRQAARPHHRRMATELLGTLRSQPARELSFVTPESELRAASVCGRYLSAAPVDKTGFE
jgi:hypothetical protein